jgi:hypothetical protein
MNVPNAMKTTITKRILKLELGAGLIETAESRHARETLEALRRRRAARLAREGLPPEEPDDEREDLSGLTLSQILRMRYSRMQTKTQG